MGPRVRRDDIWLAPPAPSHRHLAVPHGCADGEAFGRIDDGVGVDAVVAVEVSNSAGLAELLDAERLDPVATHAAEPAERCRMAVDHGHDAAVARQRGQQFFDMAEILDATALAPQIPRGGPSAVQPVGRGYRQQTDIAMAF